MSTSPDPVEAFLCPCGTVLKPPCCGNPSCPHTHTTPLLCPECGAVHQAHWGRGQRTRVQPETFENVKAVVVTGAN
jgi:hypothetical protein